jgi:phosphonate transport system ATP-binding protein
VTPPVVELSGVAVRIGPHAALTDVDLRIGVGERVALLGPSGAGKSTLLGLLTSRVTPSVGSVSVLGHDLAALSPSELRHLRQRIGSVSQSLDLVGQLRVVHNVAAGRLGRWSLPRAAWSLLRATAEPETLTALTKVGLADRTFDRTDSLSGGEQQRVAVARVLLADPELILADEPVSSLDPGLAAEVLRLLVEASRETRRTLVVSLHDPVLARRFVDRLVGLREGRVVFDLPVNEVDGRRLELPYDRAGVASRTDATA